MIGGLFFILTSIIKCITISIIFSNNIHWTFSRWKKELKR